MIKIVEEKYDITLNAVKAWYSVFEQKYLIFTRALYLPPPSKRKIEDVFTYEADLLFLKKQTNEE